MGREATCRARFEGRTTTGRAQLETDFVSFRADGVRVKVPFVQITTVETNDGSLRVVWDGESLELELGAQADAWADRIRNPRTLISNPRSGHLELVVPDIYSTSVYHWP